MYWAAGVGDLAIWPTICSVKRALMEMSTVVTSMRARGREGRCGGFGVEPEVEFVARAFGEFRVGGLGIEAAAHDDDALGELGELRIGADGEGDVGHGSGGEDGDLMRMGVDLADEEMDGVFASSLAA